MKNLIQRFIREEAGQDLIEYALLGSVPRHHRHLGDDVLSGKINDEFTKVGNALS